MTLRGLLLLGATALFGAIGAALPAPAWAQTPPARPAAIRADTASTWTVQLENDSFGVGVKGSNDKYYTSGLRLGWTSAPTLVPDTLKGLAATLWGAGDTRVSVDLNQQIYTPYNTQLRNPPRTERPYAGVLMADFGLWQDGKTQTGYDTRSALVLGLGIVGPAAGGQAVQNGFHGFINQRSAKGWSTQLANEPLIQITSERIWRLPIARLGPLETDWLPSLTASVGNLRDYVQTGVMIRLGQNLGADFGAPRQRPGVSGGDYYSGATRFAWYVFAGADGRGVARDLTLEGNTFQNSRSVKKVPFVGELQAGLGAIVYGVRITYVHRFTSQEFRGQRGGMQQTGSLALSVRF